MYDYNRQNKTASGPSPKDMVRLVNQSRSKILSEIRSLNKQIDGYNRSVERMVDRIPEEDLNANFTLSDWWQDCLLLTFEDVIDAIKESMVVNDVKDSERIYQKIVSLSQNKT